MMIEETAGPKADSSRLVTPYDEILTYCDEFIAAWEGPVRPSIADYLSRVGDGFRGTLFKNLLRFEIERRRQVGEIPRASEYLARFPDLAALVRQAFLESMSSLTAPPLDHRADVVDTTVDFGARPVENKVPKADTYATRIPDELTPDAADTDPFSSSVDRGRQSTSLVGADRRQKLTTSVLDGGTATKEAGSGLARLANRLGDYRLVRELGRGGMGVVYEAVHVSKGHLVALKVLPQVDGSRLYRFKREFRSAAGLSHPNLIGLHNLEADGDQWFFTMELVDGPNFLEYVRPEGRLDEARLRSSLAQLALGVMALHGYHIIHRDLKPSNVIVNRDGRVLVLDFGLVLEMELHSLMKSADQFAGTPAYMAPEQVSGGRLAPSCDWYAVGTMLYQALAGGLPFSGHMMEILQGKLNLDPPALPDDASIPGDLAALCLQLLERDPARRPDALEIAKRVSPGLQPSPTTVVQGGSADRLIGRDLQMQGLQEAYRKLNRDGKPEVVSVLGRSGEGKSTLAEHFLATLRQQTPRPVIMAGRCYDRESVPFKALDSLVDTLASYLLALPETDAALLMPDDIGVLARVFPVLQRVGVVARAGGAPLAILDEQQIRVRAFRALRSLLGRIGRTSPIVWFIDDLQWGDADSAEALFELLKPPEAPRVLFLGAARSDETEGSPFLKMWKELQRKAGFAFDEREVKLTPLTTEECAALMIKLLGQDNPAIRARAAEFARETQGNPFLLIELVGCFDPENDSFEPIPLHEVLTRKLGRLPAEASLLLDVLAVSGQALALEEASLTAGHDLIPLDTITRMTNERLVRMVGPDDHQLLDTYHDRVRETVLDQMGEDRCKSIHRTFAGVIEQTTGGLTSGRLKALERGEFDLQADPPIPRVFDLAYHYDAAGDRREACAYALLAARQARRQLALDVTVKQYAVAVRNAEKTSILVRNGIAEGSGEALMLLGRYDEAIGWLETFVDQAEASGASARVDNIRGEIALKQGLLDRSIAYYEKAMRRLGRGVPKTLLGFTLELGREIGVQVIRSRFPRRVSPKEATEEARAIIRSLNLVSQPYMFQNIVKAMWSHMRAMNLVERIPASPSMVFSYAAHACVCAMLGLKDRGIRYGDRAIELSRGFDDVWGQAHGYNYKGISHHAMAQYESGIARLGEAIEAFERTGDLWELHMAHFHRGMCQLGLGNLAGATNEARWTFASSARLGDNRVFCSSYLWARATAGNFPFDELQGCLPSRPDDIMSSVHGLMAEGLWHSHHGRTAEALAVFERAAATVRKSHCVNSHTILTLPMLARAVRLHAQAVEPTDPKLASRLRRRALGLARWAARVTRFLPGGYPMSLRELAASLEATGRHKEALKFAELSLNVAERQQARYELAQSSVVRWRIAQHLGLPGAAEQLGAAETKLEGFTLDSPS